MLDIAGGIILAGIVTMAVIVVVALVQIHWGQIRCMVLGHRMEDAAGLEGHRRSSGVLSFRAHGHCRRCDRWTLLDADRVARRAFLPKTWRQF